MMVGSAKLANFAQTLPWQCPYYAIRKINNWLIKPCYTSTNPDNLVKIGSVDSEMARIKFGPQKIKTINAWQSLAYSLLGDAVSPPSR